jgi:hypothetical protein
MARRRMKKRTQPVQNESTNQKNGAGAMNRSPKSMIIRIGAGEVGSSVSQLVKDFRSMMEPDTASRLKVRNPPTSWQALKPLTDHQYIGTPSEQTQRLHHHGWAIGGYTSGPFLQI